MHSDLDWLGNFVKHMPLSKHQKSKTRSPTQSDQESLLHNQTVILKPATFSKNIVHKMN
uniref:Uncharacterized protein n=1 Tax=Nelumbo nucifera TaxID=4432 RepID=A0A822ZCM6_NELNU|nr:TPA_asm: hypothetical protein HUJ06_000523 [Nelumbo nucifera]